MKSAAIGSILLGIAASVSAQNLQFINESAGALEVFRLKPDAQRVSQGAVAPGKQLMVPTTLGQRFLLVDGDGVTKAEVTSEVPVQGFRYDPPNENGVPALYTQRASAGGFPIVASATVNPYAVKEAVFLVDSMLAKRSDVREAMIKSGARLCILAWNEFTTDLPEFSGLKPADYWDARARGTGGSESDPYCSCGEENLLGYPGDPYAAENILIHEFAHNIHLRGLVNIDPTFDRRLKETYDKAMAAGLWKGKYAAVNDREYFAEGVQSWFDDNRENDHDHNHVNTRAELLAYDPGLAAICREVFRDTELKYSKPATRLVGHLAGYDPATAPTFVWPERLTAVKAEIRAKARARGKAADGKGARETKDVSGWAVHIDRSLLTAEKKSATAKALALLKVQLDEIIRVVPAPAVAELRKVPLYFSPVYPEFGARAEFHPDADWLRENGRDPAMAKGIEFTNIEVFEADTRRMPNFALHELSHAYHNRFLLQGFDNPDLRKAYERIKANGKYDRVERKDSEGRTRMDRAYALTDPMEYFAESTEALFSRNDFFPYNRKELQQHDPEMLELLKKLWGL